jgi:hypothetical protein
VDTDANAGASGGAENAGGAITPACLAQAIGSSFFELSSVLWTTAIATTLYLFVWQRMAAEEVERKLPLFALVCIGAPLLLALLPLADASYGPAGAWCWIRSTRPAWVFIQFYAPMWAAVLFNAAVYLGTRRLLQRTVQSSRSRRAQGSKAAAGTGVAPAKAPTKKAPAKKAPAKKAPAKKASATKATATKATATKAAPKKTAEASDEAKGGSQ